jgi:hypothetical protein
VQELTNHNKLLTQQIDQYKDMIDKLQVELRLRTDDFASMDILRQKEKELHLEAINEMQEEIKIILTKNTHLEQKNLLLGEELMKFETERSRNEMRTRNLSAVAANSKQKDKLLSDISNLLQAGAKQKKRERSQTKPGTITSPNLKTSRNSPQNTSISQRNAENTIL